MPRDSREMLKVSPSYRGFYIQKWLLGKGPPEGTEE
jgi:hypothetical protein